ncbi:hypothetical protein CBL_06563 [Carabus blaptoides fortunei]
MSGLNLWTATTRPRPARILQNGLQKQLPPMFRALMKYTLMLLSSLNWIAGIIMEGSAQLMCCHVPGENGYQLERKTDDTNFPGQWQIASIECLPNPLEIPQRTDKSTESRMDC